MFHAVNPLYWKIETMRVLITGADGFIARNLALHLARRSEIQVLRFTRSDTLESLERLLEVFGK